MAALPEYPTRLGYTTTNAAALSASALVTTRTAEHRPTTSPRVRVASAVTAPGQWGEPARTAAQRGPQRAGGPHPGPAPKAPRYTGNKSSARRVEAPDREAERARQDRKEARYRLRSALWGVTTLDACRGCGRNAVSPSGLVGLRVGGEGAGFSGLATCGSVWACPVCAAKIAARRSDDLGAVLTWAAEAGHTVALLTLTARHRAGQSLREVWDAVGGAWSHMTSGRAWIRTREAWGLVGWARAVEVTHGANGWHVHLHIVLVLDGQQTRECVDRMGEAMWPRWLDGLARRGFTALRGPGLDIRMGSGDVGDALSSYLVKSLAAEATMGQQKEGRHGGRTPFQILASVLATGDADDLDLWHEWERTSKGRRQLSWSQREMDLRRMAGLAAEDTDEEVAAETVEGDDLMLFDAEAWRVIAPQQGSLLVVAERWGIAGARGWLRQRGITWTEAHLPPAAARGGGGA